MRLTQKSLHQRGQGMIGSRPSRYQRGQGMIGGRSFLLNKFNKFKNKATSLYGRLPESVRNQIKDQTVSFGNTMIDKAQDKYRGRINNLADRASTKIGITNPIEDLGGNVFGTIRQKTVGRLN